MLKIDLRYCEIHQLFYAKSDDSMKYLIGSESWQKYRFLKNGKKLLGVFGRSESLDIE